jgi:hypothetical protein
MSLIQSYRFKQNVVGKQVQSGGKTGDTEELYWHSDIFVFIKLTDTLL